MVPARISWRDRWLLLNGVLFCVLGVVLLARYFMGQMPAVGAILGIVTLAFGVHRLWLARRELRKRASGAGGK
jgi:uncharacterized membrane protein HdeD (DUF308 family)